MKNTKCLFLQGQRIDIGRNGRVTLQGNGRPATEVRAIDSMCRFLIVHGALHVHVEPGEVAQAVIVGDENLLQLVDISVDDGVLTVGVAQNLSYASGDPLQLRLQMPHVVGVRQAGTGSVTLTGLQQDRFGIVVSGTGSVTAAGQADAVLLHLPGAGSIDAAALKAAHADIEVKGTGDVGAFASTSAKVRVSGAGTVRVQGQPAERDVQCGPAGTVSFLER